MTELQWNLFGRYAWSQVILNLYKTWLNCFCIAHSAKGMENRDRSTFFSLCKGNVYTGNTKVEDHWEEREHNGVVKLASDNGGQA